MPSDRWRSLLAAVLAVTLCLGLFPSRVRAGDEPVRPLEEMVRQARQCPGRDIGPVLDRVLAAGLDNQLDPDQARAILALFLDACARGLPLAPLADKTAEGLAKRVPGSRLVPVLTDLIEDHAYAAWRLRQSAPPGREVTPEMIIQAGSALATGMDRADFDAVLDLDAEAPPDMRATALGASALMLAAGYPRQPLFELMAQGLSRQSLTPEWRHLPSLAVRAEKRGLPREEILSVALDILSRGGSIREFMEGLGFTGRDLQHGATPTSERTGL